MRDFDTASIRDGLQRLKIAAPAIFGSNEHHFKLNAPLGEAEVLAFERQHAIRLPLDYRRFLIELGNGGAGPFYGIHPLGAFDRANGEVQAWRNFVGSLAEPFAYREPWNDLTGRPDAALADRDEKEYERLIDAFERRYWDPSVMNGAFPICHKGCALRIWLVVSGDEAGTVWGDDRADYRGIAPILTHDGRRATFGAWYAEWLDDALRLGSIGSSKPGGDGPGKEKWTKE
jgi:hypothetical protein